MIRELTAASLERLVKDLNEQDFLIIDVRQSKEYRLDHIPGALHIPLSRIQVDPLVLGADRKMIFYCRQGSRSKVAVIFAAEAGCREENLYHLKGGMSQYSGEILLETPKVEIFPKEMTPGDAMKHAFDLEKGAFLFYTRAKKIFKGTRLFHVMEKMGQAEVSHAKSIYRSMKKNNVIEMAFDLFFDSCKGRIFEGGKSMEEIEKFFSNKSSENCIDLLDFSMELEFCAYDLYKTMAVKSTSASLKEMFFTLSQAEKKHIETLVHSIPLCGEDD